MAEAGKPPLPSDIFVVLVAFGESVYCDESSHSVFVVDDESVIASSLEIILRKQGFVARAFLEPVAALQGASAELCG